MRYYKRKTDRVSVPPEILLQGCKMLKEGQFKNRTQAALALGISRKTLCRYEKRFLEHEADRSKPLIIGGYASRTVFTSNHENVLEGYLLKVCSSNENLKLKPKSVRKLAYHFAKALNLKMPEAWENNEEAGSDWFWGFRKRHPDLAFQYKPVSATLVDESNVYKLNLEDFCQYLNTVKEAIQAETPQPDSEEAATEVSQQPEPEISYSQRGRKRKAVNRNLLDHTPPRKTLRKKSKAKNKPEESTANILNSHLKAVIELVKVATNKTFTGIPENARGGEEKSPKKAAGKSSTNKQSKDTNQNEEKQWVCQVCHSKNPIPTDL